MADHIDVKGTLSKKVVAIASQLHRNNKNASLCSMMRRHTGERSDDEEISAAKWMIKHCEIYIAFYEKDPKEVLAKVSGFSTRVSCPYIDICP